MDLNPISDKAKCEGKDCAYKNSCDRFVRPAGAFQVWAAFYALEDDDCEYFESIPSGEDHDNRI